MHIPPIHKRIISRHIISEQVCIRSNHVFRRDNASSGGGFLKRAYTTESSSRLLALRQFWERHQNSGARGAYISPATWKELVATHQLPRYEIMRLFWRWSLEKGEITPQKKQQVREWMEQRANTSADDSTVAQKSIKELAENLSLTPYQVSNIIYELKHQGTSTGVSPSIRDQVRRSLMVHGWHSSPELITELQQSTGLGRRQVLNLINSLDDERQPITQEQKRIIQARATEWFNKMQPKSSTGPLPKHLISTLAQETQLATRQISRTFRHQLSKNFSSKRRRQVILDWIKTHRTYPDPDALHRLHLMSGYRESSIAAMIEYAMQPKGEITEEKRNFLSQYLEKQSNPNMKLSKTQLMELGQQTRLHWQQVKNVLYTLRHGRRRKLSTEDREIFFTLLSNPRTTAVQLEQERTRHNLTRRQLRHLQRQYREEQARQSEVTDAHRSAIRLYLEQNAMEDEDAVLLRPEQINELLSGACSDLTRAQIRHTSYSLAKSLQGKKPITAMARLSVQSWLNENKQEWSSGQTRRISPHQMRYLQETTGLSTQQIRSLVRQMS